MKLPQFNAINMALGNLKRSLSGTYHAFDFAINHPDSARPGRGNHLATRCNVPSSG